MDLSLYNRELEIKGSDPFSGGTITPPPAGGGATVTSEAVYWHHNDHLGTPQALTDINGTVVWTMSQTPFGITSVNEDPDGDGITVTNNFRFPGQYYDSETGLNYNYQRTYDPAIGGYTQHDPIGLNGGMNPFGYVGGNPVSYTDPRGLVEWKGSQKTLSASLGGGAIEFLFTLKSECVNGKRGIVKITAGGFVLSVGFPASATYSRSVTFDDGMTSIDPSVFSGAARYEYISYAVGVAGGSYQAIQLGNAHSVGGGFQQGLDSSIGFGQGSSFVTSSKIIDCECK